MLVAHNARFDLAFLDREVERLTGRRVAAPVVDTVWLARRLLEGRTRRVGLAALAHFFGTAARPCHRALPDAEATAEALLHLIGLAQERGARTVADLVELSAPRARRLHAKRTLAPGRPRARASTSSATGTSQVLYVGRARDLRARLRSYFRGDRQRPAVEAALGALARVEWRVLGSELEAALEELRLIRELRPPANARGGRADRLVVPAPARARSGSPARPRRRYGPIAERRLAQRAARALGGWEGEPGAALPAVRVRHAAARRPAALRGRRAPARPARALERVVRHLAELDRLRALEACLLAPAAEEGFARATFVTGGRIAAVRTLPGGAAGRLEAELGFAAALRAEPSLAADDAEELLLVASFLRSPPPELSGGCRCRPRRSPRPPELAPFRLGTHSAHFRFPCVRVSFRHRRAHGSAAHPRYHGDSVAARRRSQLLLCSSTLAGHRGGVSALGRGERRSVADLRRHDHAELALADDNPASNYQAVWLYPKSPSTPYARRTASGTSSGTCCSTRATRTPTAAAGTTSGGS